MVRRALAIAAVLAGARAAHADEIDHEARSSSTWVDAELDFGTIESHGDAVGKFGLGIEVRQRIVAGLRVGVRGAVLALRGQDGTPEMPDNRQGIGLTAAATIDYVIPHSRWVGIRWTIAPEVGAGVTQLRGLGAGDAVVRSVFAGPRLGLEMAVKGPHGTPALMSARTWGAHVAFHVVEAGGETSWQAVVGYDWGR